MHHLQSAVALQWYGPLVVPMGKGKVCTSPKPKLRYQSTPILND